MMPQRPRHTTMGALGSQSQLQLPCRPLCCIVPIVWLFTGVWEAAGKHQRFLQLTHVNYTREYALGCVRNPQRGLLSFHVGPEFVGNPTM